MMDVESLEQKRGRKPDEMQTLTNTALIERADTAEPALSHLDLAAVSNLLRERGYDLVDRFGHVHATTDTQELHVCLLADLAAMSPSEFLARLDEASKQSLQYVLSLRYQG
jgi:hypothetical protein